ncbi:MAG: TrkH family potassium uptake protein [Muribaculaceae bacterium]
MTSRKECLGMQNYFANAIKAIGRLVKRSGIEGLISLGYKSRIPQRQLLVGYMAYAIIGSLLLIMPFSRTQHVAVIDNVFTAMSALSTTGLSTVDVSGCYTFGGQMVILLLIQMGGVGYMTISSYITLQLNKHLQISGNRIIESSFPLPSGFNTSIIVRSVIRFALLFEALGIALLYPYFLINHIPQALWSAVFHTISAFCTAGFSIYSDNLMQFSSDIYVNTVIMFLSYMGAIGFIIMADVHIKLTHRGHRLSFTSKVILCATTIMTLFASVHLYFFEPSITGMDTKERLLTSLFHAVSAMTTAGFNTISLSGIVPISTLALIITMYIGASPSGTGGGLKSTTLTAVYAYTRSRLSLKKDVTLMNSVIPEHRIHTALTTVVVYSFLLITGIYLTAVFEPSGTDIANITFEATSAIATTGLSVGNVSTLSTASKMVFVVLMFAGRLGMITLGNALLVHKSQHHSVSFRDIAV